MVLTEHKKFYDAIFKIDGFLNSPFLMFGFQELTKGFNPRLKDAKAFKGLLHLMGVNNVTVLDYEDPRANIHFDMNYAFNQHTNKLIDAFNVVADVGCLEHVWNSAQAMKNCMDAVKVGGLYFLHTPVAGYFRHGFHTFNPSMLKWVVQNNGFEIEYCKFSFKNGKEVERPMEDGKENSNILIWLVARRVEIKDKFYHPIQDRQKIHKSYTQETYSWKDEADTRNVNKGVSGNERTEGKKFLAVRSLRFAGENKNYSSDKPIPSTLKSQVQPPPAPIPVLATGGYVGEGHDPVWLGNQNLNL